MLKTGVDTPSEVGCRHYANTVQILNISTVYMYCVVLKISVKISTCINPHATSIAISVQIISAIHMYVPALHLSA